MRVKDKLKHFLLSFILAGLVFYLTSSETLTLVVVLGLGLLKELYDQFKNKNSIAESLADGLADVIGITVGILLVQYFF